MRGNARSRLSGDAGGAEQALCVDPHEYGPLDVAAWQAWADTRAATHAVEACPDCGLYVVWRPHAPPSPSVTEPGLFDLPESGDTQ